MVDTERFQLGPDLVHAVSSLAAWIAVQRDDRVSPLEVLAYLPVDVECVRRVLESVEGEFDLERTEDDGILYFVFGDPERHAPDDPDAETETYVDALENNLSALKSGDDWTRDIREQHELVRIASEASERRLELSYFLDHSDVPSARVQSILNDFGAGGYAFHEFDDETDGPLEYTFPELGYPEERFERNMTILEELEGSESSNQIWRVLGAFALLLLIVVILVKFYAS